jgi:hypothetical protein
LLINKKGRAKMGNNGIRQDGSAFVTKDDAAFDSIGSGLAAIIDDDIERDSLGVLNVWLQASAVTDARVSSSTAQCLRSNILTFFKATFFQLKATFDFKSII